MTTQQNDVAPKMFQSLPTSDSSTKILPIKLFTT